ncbi:hypothetical protein AG1IA_03765 [Rhizoctonia solani AG-1 IA]|uniref:Uncharacterized protein n=1 Tax=Thanatephorus cucumeris (strain AG1-IA) TaxID=983506 RepID=L8WW41_THACA|nr:hypothetical protein AG1IA_03765 [Rhizoctonia solani AG-1 IA]
MKSDGPKNQVPRQTIHVNKGPQTNIPSIQKEKKLQYQNMTKVHPSCSVARSSTGARARTWRSTGGLAPRLVGPNGGESRSDGGSSASGSGDDHTGGENDCLGSGRGRWCVGSLRGLRGRCGRGRGRWYGSRDWSYSEKIRQ